MSYRHKKVLVLGGMGFIGLNLVKRLLADGSQLTVLDIAPVPLPALQGKINYFSANLSDKQILKKLVADQEVMFNLAGKSGPAASLADPIEDLNSNVIGVLTLLEAVREINPSLKIIFPGSRLEFGKVAKNPVKEDDPMRPSSIYGIHKLVAEKYHLAYHDNYDLKTTVLRISNLYGPHRSQGNSKYNIINYFIDQAVQGQTLQIFGEGSQLRDQLYIGDLVDLFLAVGENDATDGEVYNVGFGKGVPLLEVAQTIVSVVGKGKVEKVPWDPGQLKLETGDFVNDITKVTKHTDWKPKTSVAEGIRFTVREMEDPFWQS